MTFDESGAGKKDLPELIQKAKERMGMSDGDKDFSKDVLCISVEGPEMSKGGIKTVNDLVDCYMAQPKSIMLVIVEANIEIARHGALARARDHDPMHERTLGLVTKPDLAKGQGDVEAEHIRLAQNQEPKHKLRLGWHVLRNRAENEETPSDRDATEKEFLESPPWDAVDSADRGIARLREKLSYILYNHTRSCLPVVIEDIERHLEKRQQEKVELGKERLDHKDMRTFLLTIATDFQRLLREANSGHYADNFFGPLTLPQNRLRAELRGFHRAFDYILASKGHRLSIARADEDEIETEDESIIYIKLASITSAAFLDTHPYQFPPPKQVSRSELKRELRALATAYEGRELPGTCNSELVIHLFKIQASPWRNIAQFHIRSVAKAAKVFVEQLLHHVVGRNNAHTTEKVLLRDYVDTFFRVRGKQLDKKLDELLAPYTEGYAVPSEEEFERLASEWRVARMVKQLQKLPLKDIIQDVEDKETTSKAYYKMSLRTFTDNVTNLAIEGCLIQDLETIFTPVKVGGMSNDRLEELASESATAQSRRVQLEEEITALQGSLAACLRRMPRAVPTLCTPDASNNTRGSLFWSVDDSSAKKLTEQPAGSLTTSKSDATGPPAQSLRERSPAASKSPSQAAKIKGKSISQSPSKDAKGSSPASTPSSGSGGDEGETQDQSDIAAIGTTFAQKTALQPEFGTMISAKQTDLANSKSSGVFGKSSKGFSFGSSAGSNKTSLASPGISQSRKR